jgi:hypothetical protein
MPRAPVSLSVGVVVYFLAMAGISLFGLTLASVVTAKTIALSLPYLLDKNPRKPSRIEQRRIDVAQAVPPMPVAKLVAFEKPAVPYDVLVAQLDLAETEDLRAGAVATKSLRGVGRAKFRLKRLASKFATPSAADVFNRSFGVIPIASN